MIRAAKVAAAILAEAVWLSLLSVLVALCVACALLDHLGGDADVPDGSRRVG